MTRVHTLTSAVLALVAAVVLGVTLLATQEKPAPADKQPQQMMSMGDMMKSCREHCQATTKSIDQLSKSLSDAKASNDVNKMRNAIDQAQKPLTDMKEHMTMCMNMMNMMEKMHGKDMK